MKNKIISNIATSYCKLYYFIFLYILEHKSFIIKYILYIHVVILIYKEVFVIKNLVI